MRILYARPVPKISRRSAPCCWRAIQACLPVIMTAACWKQLCRFCPGPIRCCLRPAPITSPKQMRLRLSAAEDGHWRRRRRRNRRGRGACASCGDSSRLGRRRIGASLLARCFSDAETQAQVRIFHCYASLNAVRFYQACGFEIVGPIDMPMGPDLKFPSVLMTRRLVS
jgi:hypothetical protein